MVFRWQKFSAERLSRSNSAHSQDTTFGTKHRNSVAAHALCLDCALTGGRPVDQRRPATLASSCNLARVRPHGRSQRHCGQTPKARAQARGSLPYGETGRFDYASLRTRSEGLAHNGGAWLHEVTMAAYSARSGSIKPPPAPQDPRTERCLSCGR